MSSQNKEKIIRHYVGELPILKYMAERLGVKPILSKYIGAHGNEKMSAVDTLMILLSNLAVGRRPLYELEAWVKSIDPRIFGYTEGTDVPFTDDRFGRALDKLYRADRASCMTEIVMQTIAALHLDLSQVHNDSTTVKAYGKIPGTTESGLSLERGVSKDHRPDLKQLVYCLTVSRDGAVPIHYKSYAGNRTDDTTHIETWDTLCRIVEKKDFVYVADCKVCTDEQLTYIAQHGGRVITVVPETWKETRVFREELRKERKPREILLRKKTQGTGEITDTVSYFLGIYRTQKRGYALHWIHSRMKEENDRIRREQFLHKAEQGLAELRGRINKRRLKTQDQIETAVYTLLKKYKVTGFYEVDVVEQNETYRIQMRRGRPGLSTEYRIVNKRSYVLSWVRNKEALREEKNVDGIFPLLCTDTSLVVREVFNAYKYQPRLEKRFTQFKKIHKAAPLLFKKIERVESLMFLFFVALILQAAIERAVRLQMKEEHIDRVPLYPEDRIAYHPTTAKIFYRFEGVSRYQLTRGAIVVKEFRDSLLDIHMKILGLLHMSEHDYWA